MTVDAVRVAILGPITVSSPDGVLDARLGETAGALLVALALADGEARSVAGLADDVWGDDAPQHPKGALQTAVSRLRTHAGADIVRSVAGGYALGTDSVDLRMAESLVQRAKGLSADDPARAAILDDVLSLWRGEPGADLLRAPVARRLADSADALRTEAGAERVRSLLALGSTTEAVTAAKDLVASRPFDQAAVGDLMSALAADGRPHEGIAVFASFRGRLRTDLGASPGAELDALHTALLRDRVTGPRPAVRLGLRASATGLIGRDADVADVGTALAHRRLVTIVGAGGLGKTRLAEAVAAGYQAPIVVFVPLAGVRSDGDVALAVAGGLGLPAPTGSRLAEAGAPPDLRSRILERLAERPTLLVLDNCEQIVRGVADWVADALAATPGLRVLATSRTALAVAGEVVYPLAPLASFEGASRGPAVRLFIERARAIRPAAALPLDIVARICERLDGLPLAIELAAARVRTMSPSEIESRLADRFALLTTGDRSAPPRHRTLQAVIEWSWDLLDEDARRAFMRLAWLPAGFTAGVAAAVVGRTDADDVLDRLVAQSLVLVGDDPDGGHVRFRMLETIREFGLAMLERTGETADAATAVREWALGFALDRVAHVQETDGFRALNDEHDNLVTVLRRALQAGDQAETAALFAALGQVWIVRGVFAEIGTFAMPVIDLLVPEPDTAGRRPASALSTLDSDPRAADALAISLLLGTVGAREASLERRLRLVATLRTLVRRTAISPRWRAFVAILAASASFVAVRRVVEELSASADRDEALVGSMLFAQLSENDGDIRVARNAAVRAWQLAVRGGEPWVIEIAANTVGQLESQSAKPAAALEWFERADDASLMFGSVSPWRQAWVRGANLLALGRIPEARAVFSELVDAGETSGDGLPLAAIGAFGLAEVERFGGDREAAAGMYEAALVGLRSSRGRSSPWLAVSMAALIAATVADATLPPERIEWWARRLRARIIATRRIRPMFVDRPALGATLIGVSAWTLSVPRLRDRGVRLLALADALGARQDLVSLTLAAHWERATRIVGATAVASARAEATGLTQAERTDRAYDLVLAD